MSEESRDLDFSAVQELLKKTLATLRRWTKCIVHNEMSQGQTAMVGMIMFPQILMRVKGNGS